MDGHSIGESATAGDSVRSLDPKDRALLKRITIAIVAGFLFVAAFDRLDVLYSHKFFDVTGRAVWIWAPEGTRPQRTARSKPSAGVTAAVQRSLRSAVDNLREVAALVPVRDGRFDRSLARDTLRDLFTRDDRPLSRRDNPLAFFATRNFDLPASRYYTHIKIAADPEYTLYFNGREIAGRRFGDDSKLDVYDVSDLSRTGRNRIVVAVRSTTGFGGMIVAVDLSPELENYIVTDGSWSIERVWTDDLLLRDRPVGSRPVILGAPPVGRWNYLDPVERPLETPPSRAIEPRSANLLLDLALPQIRDISGTPVVGKRPERAIAFDFGFVDGRLRVTRLHETDVPEIVNVRFANAADELRMIEGPIRPFVFAPGESTLVDTEVRHFRYASVYGRPARADVLQ